MTEEQLNLIRESIELVGATYTRKELAEKLCCNENLISKLAKNGLLDYVKVGRSYIFTQKSVNNFLEKYKNCDLSNDQQILYYKKRA